MEIVYKSFDFQDNILDVYSLFKDYKDCFLLDSSLKSDDKGRFSFIGFDPFYVLKSKNDNTFSKLRCLLKDYQINSNYYLPFLGGAVGYFAYDLAQVIEKKIKFKAKDDLNLPDFYFGFYDAIIACDHLTNKLIIVSTGLPEKKEYLRQIRAKERLNFIVGILKNYKQAKINSDVISVDHLLSNFSKVEYIKAIKKTLQYIAKGDIYQVNISQRFSGKIYSDSFSLFKKLRRVFPTDFGVYFNTDDFKIISGSPERFLKVNNRIVEACPMKGTRPRGRTKEEDLFFKKELIKNKKEQAELLMIIDLIRNDLGRVCNYNSIRVINKRKLEEYKTVFQTIAIVRAMLHKEKDNIDLLMATLPGGSITGCPKIRAVEIIDEIEPLRRAIYTGSFGYLSFSGNLDLNILIRTFLIKQNNFYFQVGGGIVSDSTPELEYDETLTKARALMEALDLCK
ncbi:MAG: anthranilate synthase component I family protein [Candidatus Omnitrophota bacterium]